jgi:hypothetical protein
MGKLYRLNQENKNDVTDTNGMRHDDSGKFAGGGGGSTPQKEPSDAWKKQHEEYTKNIEKKRIYERAKHLYKTTGDYKWVKPYQKAKEHYEQL